MKQKETVKKQRGRPNEVDKKIEDNFDLIKKYFRYGMTEIQVCDLINIGISSFTRYKEKNPELWSTLKNEKQKADVEIIGSLYKRALGFEYDELKQDGTQDENGKLKIKSVTKIRKYVSPDTTAIIYWLRNRQGWVDKIDAGLASPKELPDFEGKSDEEVDEMINQYQKANGSGH